ncbi:cupin-like domain-containing protein [Paraglaciecola arctica]|nr:cupin-like domain-containing protein [Paraglaciecola arctica]
MSEYFSTAPKVTEMAGCTLSEIPDDVLNSSKPLILRGLVSQWPLVQAANASSKNAIDYIRQYYQGMEIGAFVAGAEQEGRYFYNAEMNGFNFSKQRGNLEPIFDFFCGQSQPPEQKHIYVGSANVDQVFPGFKNNNNLPALDKLKPLTSIWLGNQSRIAAHHDTPQNIACCVAGKRRVTLFSPEQVENLYIGPLDLTPAGQAISLVDFHKPDLHKYPKFQHVKPQIAELQPGDALVIPSLWWHHVEGLSNFNALVNFWWSDSPSYSAAPMDALLHALLAIKHLPKEQKQAWKSIYDHYIFNQDEHAFDYLPEAHKGLLTNKNELAARHLRRYLLNKLNR